MSPGSLFCVDVVVMGVVVDVLVVVFHRVVMMFVEMP